MQIGHDTGLVLEGGGMRGVFTCGVLDAFMNHGLSFNYIVAVSAGACNGLSYMSHQPGRAKASNIDYLEKYKYIGIRYLLTQGCLFDQKLLYDVLPQKLLPFDFDACFSNRTKFEMVTTNCLTGEACYLSERHNRQRLLDIVRASSSLPYVSKMVYIDGVPMLDGGIVDSIPIKHSIECGHAYNVVILTRPSGFRSSGRFHKMPPFIYHHYPKLRNALSRRSLTYNEQLEMTDELEQNGQISCIRPTGNTIIDRIERNPEKLIPLYNEGYILGDKFCREHH